MFMKQEVKISENSTNISVWFRVFGLKTCLHVSLKKITVFIRENSCKTDKKMSLKKAGKIPALIS